MPSDWKYRSIRVTTSRAVPRWLAIFSWVRYSVWLPSRALSSSRNWASRWSNRFHMTCSISHMTSENRLAMISLV